MKKIHFLAFLLTLQTSLFGFGAYAKDSASLTFGCAPWDGRTLDLKIDTPDATYQISIWDKGYEDLVNGKHTITIDNRTLSPNDRNVAGRADKINENINNSGSKYSPVNLTVHFDELNLKEGGKASGWIQKPDGVKYPFQGIITGMALCG